MHGEFLASGEEPELLSPSHAFFLISCTNTVISTANYNDYFLLKKQLTETLLLVHDVLNVQVLRRPLLCASLLERFSGFFLLCHYLDSQCNYSQGDFFLTVASDGASLVVSDSYCTNKQKQLLKATAT